MKKFKASYDFDLLLAFEMLYYSDRSRWEKPSCCILFIRLVISGYRDWKKGGRAGLQWQLRCFCLPKLFPRPCHQQQRQCPSLALNWLVSALCVKRGFGGQQLVRGRYEMQPILGLSSVRTASLLLRSRKRSSPPSSPLYLPFSLLVKKGRMEAKLEHMEVGWANSVLPVLLSRFSKLDFNEYFESAHFDWLVEKTSPPLRIEIWFWMFLNKNYALCDLSEFTRKCEVTSYGLCCDQLILMI